MTQNQVWVRSDDRCRLGLGRVEDGLVVERETPLGTTQLGDLGLVSVEPLFVLGDVATGVERQDHVVCRGLDVGDGELGAHCCVSVAAAASGLYGAPAFLKGFEQGLARSHRET